MSADDRFCSTLFRTSFTSKYDYMELTTVKTMKTHSADSINQNEMNFVLAFRELLDRVSTQMQLLRHWWYNLNILKKNFCKLFVFNVCSLCQHLLLLPPSPLQVNYAFPSVGDGVENEDPVKTTKRSSSKPNCFASGPVWSFCFRVLVFWFRVRVLCFSFLSPSFSSFGSFR